MEGGVARLEVVDVFLVDALAAMVRVGVVDTFGSVNGGASSTAGCITVTLLVGNTWSARDWPCSVATVERKRTFDFLLRQAMQAVLTHRLFADAEAGESVSLLWDLDLVAFRLGSEVVEVVEVVEKGLFVGVWWSDSSSILVSPAISSPRRCGRSLEIEDRSATRNRNKVAQALALSTLNSVMEMPAAEWVGTGKWMDVLGNASSHPATIIY